MHHFFVNSVLHLIFLFFGKKVNNWLISLNCKRLNRLRGLMYQSLSQSYLVLARPG